jgi:hypothetical protein
MDFSPVIDQIIKLDTQPDLYLQYLKQPWFNNNLVSSSLLARDRWSEIFNSR